QKTRMVPLLHSQPGKQLQAVAVGQIKIADDHSKRPLGRERVPSLRQRTRGHGREGPFAQAESEQFPHFPVIIDYQDSIHRGGSSLTFRPPALCCIEPGRLCCCEAARTSVVTVNSAFAEHPHPFTKRSGSPRPV